MTDDELDQFWGYHGRNLAGRDFTGEDSTGD
jgi:hypothetical protein